MDNTREVEQPETDIKLPSTLQVQGFHGFSFGRHVLPQIAVYHNTSDFPGKFVARLFVVKQGYALCTSYAMIEDELGEVHEGIPEQFVRLERHLIDDPAIYEIWT